MKILTPKGFGLIEILIALGLTSVLSLVVIELMNQSIKNNLTSEVEIDALEVKSKLEEALKNKDICKLSLKQRDFGESDIDLLNWNQNKDGYQKIFQTGQTIGKVQILGISIEDESKFIATADGGYTNIIVNVDLSNSNRRKINGVSTKTLKIKTFVDNCVRSLIINQPSKENLKLECQTGQGILKNAVSGSLGWYGVCQYCREPRESIHDCDQSGG
jgi:prepilin-type N-terminal cleavage/methylation domain-containing protein